MWPRPLRGDASSTFTNLTCAEEDCACYTKLSRGWGWGVPGIRGRRPRRRTLYSVTASSLEPKQPVSTSSCRVSSVPSGRSVIRNLMSNNAPQSSPECACVRLCAHVKFELVARVSV